MTDHPFMAIDERCFVAGQLTAPGLHSLAAANIALVINNRPDGEEYGQPASAEMEAAVSAEGAAYRHIPMAGGLSLEQIAEARDALAETEGKVLLYCKSGMRSALLWAAARVAGGTPIDEVIASAENAGFGFRPYRPMFEQVAAAFRAG